MQHLDHLNIRTLFALNQISVQTQNSREQSAKDDVTALILSVHPFIFVFCSLGTGHPSIAGCTYHSFIPEGNLESPVNLTSLFLDCGRKQEYLKKNCTYKRRTRELNQESYYNHAIVLTKKKNFSLMSLKRHVFNYNGIQICDSVCELMLHSQLTKVFAS